MSDVLIDVSANLGPLRRKLQDIPRLISAAGAGKGVSVTSKEQAAVITAEATARKKLARAGQLELATKRGILIVGDRIIPTTRRQIRLLDQMARKEAELTRRIQQRQAVQSKGATGGITDPAPATGKGKGGFRQQGMMGAMAGAAKWALAWMAVYRAYNLVLSGFRDGIGTVVEFDFEMVKLHRVLNDTEEAFQRLTVNTVDLSAKWGMELTKTMGIAIEWAKQGKKAWEVQALTEATIIASTAAFMDEEKAARFLTATLNAFNMEAGRSMEIIDKVNHVSRRYAISSEEMANAIQRSAFSARAAKLSFDELQAMITVISESTRRSGEHIGVALRTLFVKWKKPKVVEVLQDVGVEVVNAEGQFNSFSDVMTQLYLKWDKLTEVEQANIMQKMAGVRRSETFLALMEKFPEVMDVMKTATEAEGSAMDEMGQVMDTTRKRVDLLKTEWSAFWAAFALSDTSGLKTTLNEVLETLAKIVKAAKDVKDATSRIKTKEGEIAGGTGLGSKAWRLGKKELSIAKYVSPLSGIGAVKKIPGILAETVSFYAKLGKETDTVADKIKNLTQAHEKEIQRLQEKVGKYQDNIKGLEGNIQRYERFAGVNDELTKKTEELLKADRKVNEIMARDKVNAYEAAKIAVKEYNDEIEKSKTATTRPGAQLGARRDVLQRGVSVWKGVQSSLQRQITQNQQAGKSVDDLIDRWLQAQSVLGEFRAKLAEVNEALSINVEVTGDTTETAATFVDGAYAISDQLNDVIKKAYQAQAAFKVMGGGMGTAAAYASSAKGAIAAAGAAVALAKMAAAEDPSPENLGKLSKLYWQLLTLSQEFGQDIGKYGGGGGGGKPQLTGEKFFWEKMESARRGMEARFKEIEARGMAPELESEAKRKAELDAAAGLYRVLARSIGKETRKGKTILTESQFEDFTKELFRTFAISEAPERKYVAEMAPVGAERLEEFNKSVAEFNKILNQHWKSIEDLNDEYAEEIYETLFLSDEDRIKHYRDRRRRALRETIEDAETNIAELMGAVEKIKGEFGGKYGAAEATQLGAIMDLIGTKGMYASADSFWGETVTYEEQQEAISNQINWTEKALKALGELTPKQLEQYSLTEQTAKIEEYHNKLLEAQTELHEINKEELNEQVQEINKQVQAYKDLKNSIRQEFQDPLMNWLTDYEQRWDETIQSIGKSIQKRQLQMAFESTGKLMDKYAGGGLAGTLALGFMPPEKQIIIEAHMQGAGFMKRAIVDGSIAGANEYRLALGLGGVSGELSGGVGEGGGMPTIADIEAAFEKGKGLKGRLRGLMDKRKNAMFSQLMATGMGVGMSVYQGGNVGMALQNAIPSAMGMMGEYGGNMLEKLMPKLFETGGALAGMAGGPLGMMAGQAGGLLLSMLTRDLFADTDKEKKERTTQVSHQETVVSSKIDLTNRKLEINNRHLAAIKESLDPLARPDSYYFRERAGVGIQDQTIVVDLKMGDDTIETLILKTVDGNLSVSQMRELQ